MTASADAPGHQPVLLEEAVGCLAVRADGVYVDATFGRGGHSRRILADLGPRGRLFAMDRDPQAVAAARAEWRGDSRFACFQDAFSRLAQRMRESGVLGAVNGVLLDLGVSSTQLDDPARGFSFLHDGPLDMRMDPASGETAAAWLQRATAEEIARVLAGYGEERHARRIASAIVATRVRTPLVSTRQLAEIVSAAAPTHDRHKHPATRSFQAIRIFINHELDELGACLEQCLAVLAPGGRLVVISFHSLEDRLVKRFLRAQALPPPPDPRAPWLEPKAHPKLRLLGKALRPDAAEIARNPRARSAVLRAAERLA